MHGLICYEKHMLDACTCSQLAGAWPDMLGKARARYCRTQLRSEHARTHAGQYEKIALGKIPVQQEAMAATRKVPLPKSDPCG